jgi:hypothetical protein
MKSRNSNHPVVDHFIVEEANAISDSAKRGWELFNTKARCHLCHVLTEDQRQATLFIDSDFHNIGIGILRHRVGWRSRLSVSWRKDICRISTPQSQTRCQFSGASSLRKSEVIRRRACEMSS